MEDDHSTSVDTALIVRAAELISAGGVAIVPTETFYGLAADPFNDPAVRRIFQIKGRADDKPLPLIAADRDTAESLVFPPDRLTRLLMDRFWPGSLTILLTPRTSMSRLIAGSADRIGVRVPPESPARAVAGRVGGAITATSANLSGDPNPRITADIDRAVRDAADLVVDLGPTPGGRPSTVVEIVKGRLRILREGAVPAAALEAVMAE